MKKKDKKKAWKKLKKALKNNTIEPFPIDEDMPKVETFKLVNSKDKYQGVTLHFFGPCTVAGQFLAPGMNVHIDFKELLPKNAYEAVVKACEIAAISLPIEIDGMKKVQKKIAKVLKG